jgi:CubicO group peptidase (beta-lactamase class C family)
MPLAGWSLTKSVMNALVGVLVKEGRLAIDAPVPVREWQTATDPRRGITLDHLLRMSSGLRFDEGMTSPRADVIRMLFGAEDMSAFATDKPLEACPGQDGSTPVGGGSDRGQTSV